MTDTTSTFDQIRASASAELDHLVASLLTAHASCDCDGEVDAMSHLIAFAGIYRDTYQADVLAALLVQAVARLALAKEAK